MSIHKAQVKESYEENPVSGGKGYKKNINRAIRMTGGGGFITCRDYIVPVYPKPGDVYFNPLKKSRGS